MSAIDVKELPFPREATKQGQQDAHAFQVTRADSTIGVLYAREPFLAGGELVIHISISKVSGGRIRPVSWSDIREVMKICKARGLDWPARQEFTRFDTGPFTGKGMHVWQDDRATPADLDSPDNVEGA